MQTTGEHAFIRHLAAQNQSLRCETERLRGELAAMSDARIEASATVEHLTAEVERLRAELERREGTAAPRD